MGLSNSNQLRNLKIRELKESPRIGQEIDYVGMDVKFRRSAAMAELENV
jgi:hypothetical protein